VIDSFLSFSQNEPDLEGKRQMFQWYQGADLRRKTFYINKDINKKAGINDWL